MSNATIHVKTKYLDEDGELSFGHYIDGALALQIYSWKNGPLLKATTCLIEHGYTPPPGAIVVKDYSENEGIKQCLIDQGVIVAQPIKTIAIPFEQGAEKWTTTWTVHNLSDKARFLAIHQTGGL